ncbi:hypothetical protein P5V15_003927 [Pogonomyrmex californicus]
MSLTSRTNRWASRVIIILQLATWNAVGIILLHRGVSTLRRRILDTNYVEANSPAGLDVESVSSMRRDGSEYDPGMISTQPQSIDGDAKIIIRVEPESSRDDKNISGLDIIRSEQLKDVSEIISEKNQLFSSYPIGYLTTDGGTRLENYLTEKDRRIDDAHLGSKNASSKISRIARNREDILENILRNDTIASISDHSREEKNKGREEDLDFAGNATQDKIETSSSEEIDDDQFTDVWRGKNNIRFSRVSVDGATTAVALVAIGAIMLLVGPVVVILRILDERRQASKLIAVPNAREDLPPTYEQAVLMGEAPRYSTLALNDERTPPPSPSLSTTYTFSNVAT